MNVDVKWFLISNLSSGPYHVYIEEEKGKGMCLARGSFSLNERGRARCHQRSVSQVIRWCHRARLLSQRNIMALSTPFALDPHHVLQPMIHFRRRSIVTFQTVWLPPRDKLAPLKDEGFVKADRAEQCFVLNDSKDDDLFFKLGLMKRDSTFQSYEEKVEVNV
ncbi:uncharacterized protein BT62DRAFT_1014056 [Guyanagaster necrorhizus]|uniref:Uncharacterized protein n=1 Tax=Guyanagaster necrorhizus TaxID=856835 RepID=A0A9P7VF17_9AGAR|nr:uncharacterized protein BT62DRAFT_1014056 [Guyanagaster necrorhizus MCA 3950]KAG7439373.1 hypothetical protein BT62DRAFT_1014056 [Guyanagaster necrorhizus MCA 3950]